jgi:molybdate transport system substrate-binding protein
MGPTMFRPASRPILLVLTAVLPAGCGDGASAERPRVVVFAAASTTEPLGQFAEAFQQRRGATVVTNFASTAALAQQILHGAPADLFLSASTQWADAVA